MRYVAVFHFLVCRVFSRSFPAIIFPGARRRWAFGLQRWVGDAIYYPIYVISPHSPDHARPFSNLNICSRNERRLLFSRKTRSLLCIKFHSVECSSFPLYFLSACRCVYDNSFATLSSGVFYFCCGKPSATALTDSVQCNLLIEQIFMVSFANVWPTIIRSRFAANTTNCRIPYFFSRSVATQISIFA